MNLEELLKMVKAVGVGDSVTSDLFEKESTLGAAIRADESRRREIEELKRKFTKAEGPYTIPPMHPWDSTPRPPFIPAHDDKIDAGKYWGGITTDSTGGSISTVSGKTPIITVDELIELAKNKDAIDAHPKEKEKVQPVKKEESKPMTQNELTGSW